MMRIPALFAAAFVTCCVLPDTAAASEKKPAPEKVVRQAEAQLKRLLKDGEDRPSVYAARFELVRALRDLNSCETNERIERELAAVAAWVERSEIPVRLSPQLVYNEVGRAARARAGCTDDPALQKSHHQAAVSAFTRASAAARRDHDALNEAITLFNAAQSTDALGDIPGAIELMESACAIDREHALHDNYREDYATLVRLKDAKSGTVTPPEDVERHLASLSREKVRFSFKPVHGDQQRYRSEMRQVEVAEGRRQERRLEAQYSGAVAVQGDIVTISLRPDESKVGGRPAKAIAATSGELTPEDLVARLLAQPLSYTVKTSGEFVGATGLEEVRRVVLEQVDKAFDASTATAQRDRARQLVEQLLSDAVINQQIASEWTMAVGWWIGAELDLGDWYTLDVDAPQALLPDKTLRYRYVFKVNRRAPCGQWDTKKSCVELIIEGTPDREQLADYLYAFMARVAGPQPRRQAKWFRERLGEDVQLVERSVLIVEPDTLKTHHQLRAKTTYVAAAERGGHPRIELQTTQSDLQGPAMNAKRSRQPASTVRASPRAR